MSTNKAANKCLIEEGEAPVHGNARLAQQSLEKDAWLSLPKGSKYRYSRDLVNEESVAKPCFNVPYPQGPSSSTPDPWEDPKSRSLTGVPIKYPLVARVPN